MNKTIQSLKWRYACKKFDNSKILSDDKIEVLSEAFNLTATSFGLQPIKMIIIQNKELQKQLQKFSFDQQQVSTASHILVICIDDYITLEDIDDYFDLEKEIRGTSELILSKYRNQLKDIYKNKSTLAKHESAINQAYIALGNLMTVCALEKIDSCPMEGFNAQKFDEILELKKQNLKSVLVLPVGYRAEDDFMSTLKKVRKPIEETVIKR
ncbi:NAD(P)H-dependent oxidoreductase [Aureibaculum sp. 2210JD6-5]|uniref:NAD(P)H-dependent oxidoreductase n=1 Tax=Aureibaculum sp. 2210JD6-5 TaxID=3103957 RepID=UPI002AACA594|nr:NAD(P)H-dependent oxidoreductase [Aureibaculum sp. 2210JD6-5]MDY7393723.1 NAD(P)H-dependent oxidoreductase [Aureibaculum sp. 2210JD6-5]